MPSCVVAALTKFFAAEQSAPSSPAKPEETINILPRMAARKCTRFLE
jgi:hypothetical protein